MPIFMTREQIKSICDCSAQAWRNASPRARSVTFTWDGKKYRSRMTSFRMLIDTMRGEPVACRYH